MSPEMEDLNNNDEEVQCLSELKTLVAECSDLDYFSSFIDDQFLLHFVRGKKFNSKQAFITLQNYFWIRTEKYNSLFKTLRPSTDPVFHNKVFRVLKNLDHQNRVVFVVAFGLWNPAVVTLDDFCKATVLFLEEAWNMKEVEKNGLVAIFDMDSFNWEHFKIWTPTQVKKCINIFWNNFPAKYKAIYIVNVMSLCTIAFKAIRAFLPSKMQDRICLYGSDLTCLHKHISTDILPKSLGGELNDDKAWDTDIIERIRDKEEYYVQFARKL